MNAKNQTNQKELTICLNVQDEINRLNNKLSSFINELKQSDDRVWSSQKRAQCKRAALDVKSILTKITQSNIYDYK